MFHVRSRLIVVMILLVLVSEHMYYMISSDGVCKSKPCRITELDWFNHDYEFPVMYSGRIDLDTSNEEKMFYWLVETHIAEAQDRLMIVFNGGPGWSSITPLFSKGSPLKFRTVDYLKHEIISDYTESYTNFANIIFIDQPLGVGLSTAKDYSIIQKKGGLKILEFLLEFYKLHPKFRDSDLVLAGGSYAGHYVGKSAEVIVDYNNNQTDEADKINLVGVFTEDGVIDSLTHFLDARSIIQSTGILPFEFGENYETALHRWESAYMTESSKFLSACKNIRDLITISSGGIPPAFVGAGTNKYHDNGPINSYINKISVQRQLGVISGDRKVHFEGWSSNKYIKSDPEIMLDYTEIYHKLIKNGVNIIAANGGFDSMESAYDSQVWTYDLANKLNSKNHPLGYYYFEDSDNSIKLGGWYVNFELDQIYENQGKLSLAILFTGGHSIRQDIYFGIQSLYKDLFTSHEAKCHNSEGWLFEQNLWDIMNNCNGHGKCNQGKCQCDPTYFGEDWGVKAKDLKQEAFQLLPRDWNYLRVPANSFSKLVNVEVSNGLEVEIYEKNGDIPHESDFISYKKGRKFTYVINESNVDKFIGFYNPDKSVLAVVSIVSIKTLI